MKLISDFRDKEIVQKILNLIKSEVLEDKEYRIMEVCGTHTMSISRFGIRSLLPTNIKLVSGPGCPVCVTSQGEIDSIFTLLKKKDIILTTFGDLMKVPGSNGETLENLKMDYDIRVVTTPIDALDIAEKSDKDVVFLGIGFETTIPTIVATILMAEKKGINNFFVIPFFKTMPEVMSLLLKDNELQIDGFLCPGHVSVITGAEIYLPIIQSNRAAVITGFEPVDILYSIYEIIEQVNKNKFELKNFYSRTVNNYGNKKALEMISEVLEPFDAYWRGIGKINNSGLRFNNRYLKYDAINKFDIQVKGTELKTGCRCGDVLKGKILPFDCKLFETKCTPENPEGPCMVSSEGVCAAYFKYRDLS